MAVIIGSLLLSMMFVLPRRRLQEEKIMKPLYEERCSAYYSKAGMRLGGNLPMTRISFYEEFFVIAMFSVAKIKYSEICSVTFNRGWLSNSVKVVLPGGIKFIFRPSKIDNIQELIEKGRRRNK